MPYLIVVLVFLFAPAALAGTSQGYGNGGRFVVYDPIVAAHNRSGELFRIQGHCQSACTLFLGIRMSASSGARGCCSMPATTARETYRRRQRSTC
jgi:hypothetical protein